MITDRLDLLDEKAQHSSSQHVIQQPHSLLICSWALPIAIVQECMPAEPSSGTLVSHSPELMPIVLTDGAGLPAALGAGLPAALLTALGAGLPAAFSTALGAGLPAALLTAFGAGLLAALGTGLPAALLAALGAGFEVVLSPPVVLSGLFSMPLAVLPPVLVAGCSAESSGLVLRVTFSRLVTLPPADSSQGTQPAGA